MPLDLSTWNGVLAARPDATAGLEVTMPLKPSDGSGTCPFLVRCSDGGRWWIKAANNPRGSRVLIAEQIVARLGAAIGAPTCRAELVRLPEALAGWEYAPGLPIVPGIAHASSAVPDAQESREVRYVDRDDNSRRYAGVIAVYDWCWGNDDQWLYCATQDQTIFSHDHDQYFPYGLMWDDAALRSADDAPRPFRADLANVDSAEMLRLAQAIEQVTHEQLVEVLQHIPGDWDGSAVDLEHLGAFIENRQAGVAARLRMRATAP